MTHINSRAQATQCLGRVSDAACIRLADDITGMCVRPSINTWFCAPKLTQKQMVGKHDPVPKQGPCQSCLHCHCFATTLQCDRTAQVALRSVDPDFIKAAAARREE